jgi:hypothetical protein
MQLNEFYTGNHDEIFNSHFSPNVSGQSRKYEIGRTFSIYSRDEKYVQNFSKKPEECDRLGFQAYMRGY